MSLTSALSLEKALTAQRPEAFAWLVAAFAGGIALYFSLRFEPALWGGAAGCALFVLLTLYCWPRRETLFISCGAALLGLFFCAGFCIAQARAHLVYTPMITEKTGPVSVTGTVDSIDMMGEGGDMRLVLKSLTIEDMAPADTPRKIRLRARRGGGIHPGDVVSGLASLNPPSAPVAPGAFDFQRQAYFEGIGAVGFFFRAPQVVMPARPGEMASWIGNARLAIAARVSERFNQPQAGLIIALMTGEQKAVAQRDYQAMRNSGLAHLLAISGMNVGMIAASIFFAVRLLMAGVPWLALRYPIKKYAAVIAFFGALFYTLIAGMSVPTQRSIIMTGIVLLAIIHDRSPFSLRLFAFSAFVLLLGAPENLTGVSFQMSFAAVMALIVFYDRARPFWTAAYSRAGWIRRGLLYMTGVLVTTVIGGTVTGIFSLYHFQTYALYNIFANMLAVPLTGVVIMPAAVVAMLAMPLRLEGMPLDIMAWGVTWMLAIARWVGGLEGAVLRLPAFPLPLFLTLSASLIFFMLWHGRLRFAALGIALLCLLMIPLSRTPDIAVSDNAALIAVHGEEGQLAFSSGRSDRYAAETWRRRNGEATETKRIVWPKEGRLGPLSCDLSACRYEKDGVRIAFLRSRQAMAEECGWANVIVADFPVDAKNCAAKSIIDRFAVWRDGAQNLYIHSGALRIDTVAGTRGQRPWTQRAADRRQ